MRTRSKASTHTPRSSKATKSVANARRAAEDSRRRAFGAMLSAPTPVPAGKDAAASRNAHSCKGGGGAASAPPRDGDVFPLRLPQGSPLPRLLVDSSLVTEGQAALNGGGHPHPRRTGEPRSCSQHGVHVVSWRALAQLPRVGVRLIWHPIGIPNASHRAPRPAANAPDPPIRCLRGSGRGDRTSAGHPQCLAPLPQPGGFACTLDRQCAIVRRPGQGVQPSVGPRLHSVHRRPRPALHGLPVLRACRHVQPQHRSTQRPHVTKDGVAMRL